MKSTKERLLSRGKFFEEDYRIVQNKSEDELIHLTSSHQPQIRSAAVFRLSETASYSNEFVTFLCQLLENEKKIYTRLEICNALSKTPLSKIRIPFSFLGKIGFNRHQTVPEKEFLKRSYPLPRDLIARTFARYDFSILHPAIDFLWLASIEQASELLDLIGFRSFQQEFPGKQNFANAVIIYYLKHLEIPLLRFKCIRAFSAFPCENVREFLVDNTKNDPLPRIRLEAARSLSFFPE